MRSASDRLSSRPTARPFGGRTDDRTILPAEPVRYARPWSGTSAVDQLRGDLVLPAADPLGGAAAVAAVDIPGTGAGPAGRRGGAPPGRGVLVFEELRELVADLLDLVVDADQFESAVVDIKFEGGGVDHAQHPVDAAAFADEPGVA